MPCPNRARKGINKMVFEIPLPPANQDASPLIQKTLDKAGDGAVLHFEKGRYYLLSPLEIRGKTGLTLDGNGCVFSPHYDREDEFEKSSDAFHIRDCDHLTLKNFKIDASLPANSAARIVKVHEDAVDVKIQSRVPFNGKERFIDRMVFDEAGMPQDIFWFSNRYDPARRTIIEGELACTAPRRLEPERTYLGQQVFRVSVPPDVLSRLEPGMLCSVSHTYYGLVAFTFRNCRDVLIEDVAIPNFGGFGFLILPRCMDFTFRRVCLRTEDFAHQPYATTSDGIHLVGLGGRLLMEDCVFERLGDDSFNIHTQVMTVRECGPAGIHLAYEKVGGIVSPDWLKPGDVLWAYDPVTLEKRGEIIAGEASDPGHFLPAHDVSFLRPGDFVTNRAYFPDTVIRNSVIRHSRGRGCCIQGVNSLLMENCEIGPAKGPAIYLSTAFNEWKEAGPLQNVVIRGNRLISSPADKPRENWTMLRGGSGILLWLRGDEYVDLPDVHRNITIENNLFIDFYTQHALYLSSADGVTVRGNRFRNCHFVGAPIVTAHCSHVTEADNRAETDAD